MIVDGKALAKERIEELKIVRKNFGALTLGVVVQPGNAVTDSYIRIKKRIAAELDVAVRESADIESVLDCDGVIVQLPLPPGIDSESLLARIPAMKDVDILSNAAYENFVARAVPPPPVPRAMQYILQKHKIDCAGKKVVVVGQGRLVGKPAAEMFRQLGADVQVVGRSDDVGAATRAADIIVLGAGDPHFLKPDMVQDGVIILDAGTSEAAGVVVGDADPGCAPKASLFTPVPGGIGPLAIAEIFANHFELKLLKNREATLHG